MQEIIDLAQFQLGKSGNQFRMNSHKSAFLPYFIF
jgi:hypothetical protein